MVRIYEEWESDRGGSGIAGDCDSGCPPVGRSHTVAVAGRALTADWGKRD